MEKITNQAELNAAIQLFEQRQVAETALLKEQFRTTYESLKPMNLIKNSLRNLMKEPDLKDSVMGLAAGHLSKKIVTGTSTNPLKQIAGTLLQMAVGSLVSRNGEEIRAGLQYLINKLSPPKKSAE